MTIGKISDKEKDRLKNKMKRQQKRKEKEDKNKKVSEPIETITIIGDGPKKTVNILRKKKE